MKQAATALPLPADLGEQIGAYRLERVIGQGGMGCVYAATHVTLGRPAAVKVAYARLSNDEAYAARLREEARIVGDLQHPNVVDIIDFIRTPPPVRLACVMELLEGPSLAEVMDERRLSPRQALNAALQLAEALEAVHARGIVHRDLKPSNVAVVAPLDSDFSGVPSVKLLDFGIAKVADPSVPPGSSGAVLGTPPYMAPEQIAAEPSTPAVDVYALLEVLAEMLTGEPVFSEGGLEMMQRKMVGPVPAIELPALPGRPMLRALFTSGWAVNPDERPLMEEVSPRLRAIRDRLRDL